MIFRHKIAFRISVCLFVCCGISSMVGAQNVPSVLAKEVAGANISKQLISQRALQDQLMRSLSLPVINSVQAQSSHLLREQLVLVTSDLETLREHYVQTGAESLLADGQLAENLANLKKINTEGASVLKVLTRQKETLLALWEQALLRERNPHFLPRKAAADVVLFDLSPIKKMSEVSISPRFFREWAFLIDETVFSETENGLISGLRKDLKNAEQNAAILVDFYLEAQQVVQDQAAGAAEKEVAKKKMNVAKPLLQKVSHQAAQDVLDLVHILNLYPTISENSLTLLAVKLDQLPVKNDFVKLLRGKIKVKLETVEEKAAPRKIGFR